MPSQDEAKKFLRLMQNVGGVPGVGANVLNQAGDVVEQVSGGKSKTSKRQ